MKQEFCPVIGSRAVAEGVYVLSFSSARIAASVRPGQFLNIRADDTTDPLLRRPFSVYNVIGDEVQVVFQIVGKGTSVLRRKHKDDPLDVLGPLGRPFTIDDGSYDTAMLIAGGLGVAPMPLTTHALRAAGKSIITLLGARTASTVVSGGLENVRIATDDGTGGYHGTVVDLARRALKEESVSRMKIFACGPTAMLRAVAQLAQDTTVACEVSLEGAMACGFGICQGCPVELIDAPQKYALMCKDGPTFDARSVRF